MSVKIGYIIGSISAASINRKVFEATKALVPADAELIEIPIVDLPMYSPDLDVAYPQAALDFKSAIAEMDSVIVATPQYNDSFSGVLKNALDWASRPWGQHSFANKPVAIASASVASHGGAKAAGHVAEVLAFGEAKVLETQFNVFVNAETFTDSGAFAKPEVATEAANFLGAVVVNARS